MESYVRRIKEEKKTDSEIYLKSKRLYETAYVKYSAWNHETEKAIAAGKASQIAHDRKYIGISEDASGAIFAFRTYYSQNGDPVSDYENLFRLGIQIWNIYKFNGPRKRRSSAQFFQMWTQWSDWDHVPKYEREEARNTLQALVTSPAGCPSRDIALWRSGLIIMSFQKAMGTMESFKP